MSRLLTDRPVLIQILSLYLLLLAFFIVLTRVSAGEQTRADAVVGSLNAAFAIEGRPAARPQQAASLTSTALNQAPPLARIGDLVRTELAFAVARDIVPGGVMELIADSARLFVGDTVAVDPLYRRFLERLAAVLADPPLGVRYDVEIAVGIGDAGPDDARSSLAVARSAFLATVLTGAGAPARTLAAGVEPDGPPRVRMVFHVRPAIESRPPFTGAQGR